MMDWLRKIFGGERKPKPPRVRTREDAEALERLQHPKRFAPFDEAEVGDEIRTAFQEAREDGAWAYLWLGRELFPGLRGSELESRHTCHCLRCHITRREDAGRALYNVSACYDDGDYYRDSGGFGGKRDQYAAAFYDGEANRFLTVFAKEEGRTLYGGAYAFSAILQAETGFETPEDALACLQFSDDDRRFPSLDALRDIRVTPAEGGGYAVTAKYDVPGSYIHYEIWTACGGDRIVRCKDVTFTKLEDAPEPPQGGGQA